MNCGHFQENLYDYLDDTLSPSEKAAAEEHLLQCSACQQAVQSELLLARTLSTRLTQAVESINLDSNARKGITRAALQTLGREEPRPHRSLVSLLLGRRQPVRDGFQSSVEPGSWQRRLVLPFAAAVLVTIGGLWLGRQFLSERSASHDPTGSMAVTDQAVSVHVFCSVPTYSFQREGNMVVDALTYDTRSMDGALLEKK